MYQNNFLRKPACHGHNLHLGTEPQVLQPGKFQTGQDEHTQHSTHHQQSGTEPFGKSVHARISRSLSWCLDLKDIKKAVEI